MSAGELAKRKEVENRDKNAVREKEEKDGEEGKE